MVQVLAVNAAKDATELVAKLRAYHHTAQTKADKKHLSRYLVARYSSFSHTSLLCFIQLLIVFVSCSMHCL